MIVNKMGSVFIFSGLQKETGLACCCCPRNSLGAHYFFITNRIRFEQGTTDRCF